MTNTTTFIHLTDTHLTIDGTPLERDDHKAKIPGIEQTTREEALGLLCKRLAVHLKSTGRKLDGVLFTGDATLRGIAGSQKLLLEMLLEHFGDLGISTANIVATPGNHDVPLGTEPGAMERYQEFVEVWRDAGCITPWLDGIDDPDQFDQQKHRLVDGLRRWAIYPINSSNWSHVSSILPEPLKDVWDTMHNTLSGGDPEQAEKLRRQLDDLIRFDMARISENQLEALRAIIEQTERPATGQQVRIALLHHHLRAPSLREEVKAFANLTNLEQLRCILGERRIDVVVHGHKHEHAAEFDHIYTAAGEAQHQTLVISGATFDAARDQDALRLLSINGYPFTPEISIERFAVPRSGIDLRQEPTISRRLWVSDQLPDGPITIQGSDLATVYQRACAVAKGDGNRGILVVHLDLPTSSDGSLPLPDNYPFPESLGDDQRQSWLKELVGWWQLDRSRLEHRIPFVHGGRLRRYGGAIDQLERIIKLLKMKASTRAIAVLIDPFRDFTVDGTKEEFASFCLVEFKRRDLAGGRRAVDAIAFYRAQEFARWWPINVAELRFLQLEIGRGANLEPGRITTIAGDARSIGRSPTQVAMPIIDRWLDQAPERIHALANALMGAPVAVTAFDQVTREWRQALAEMEQATSEYNADGVPVAIEGLEMLAAYLELANSEGGSGNMARTLRALANANRAYETTERTSKDFDRWGALPHIQDLKSQTIELLEESEAS